MHLFLSGPRHTIVECGSAYIEYVYYGGGCVSGDELEVWSEA